MWRRRCRTPVLVLSKTLFSILLSRLGTRTCWFKHVQANQNLRQNLGDPSRNFADFRLATGLTITPTTQQMKSQQLMTSLGLEPCDLKDLIYSQNLKRRQSWHSGQCLRCQLSVGHFFMWFSEHDCSVTTGFLLKCPENRELTERKMRVWMVYRQKMQGISRRGHGHRVIGSHMRAYFLDLLLYMLLKHDILETCICLNWYVLNLQNKMH